MANNTKEEKLKTIEEQLKKAQERATGLFEQVREEGVTGREGEQLIAPGTIDVGEITEVGNLQLPDKDEFLPDLSALGGRKEFFKSEFETFQQQLTNIEKRIAEGQEEATKRTKSLREKFFGGADVSAVDIEAERQAFEEKLGIEPEEFFAGRKADVAELESLMTSVDLAQAQKQEALDRVSADPRFSVAFASRESRRVSDRYNREIAALSAQAKTKAAIMDMERGDFQDANTLVRQAVSDFTWEARENYNRFTRFEEQNQDLLADLTNEQKNLLQDAKTSAKDFLTEQTREKNEVADLMLDSPRAGITLEDTLDEARNKAVEHKKTLPEEVPVTGLEGEPAPNLRAMAQRYLAAPPEEKEEFIPSAPYQQADFWNEVDYLQAQQPEVSQLQTETEFFADKEAGMPLDNALSLYGGDLEEDWVREQYKVKAEEKSLLRKGIEWFSAPYKSILRR